jgi:hypothetical protein
MVISGAWILNDGIVRPLLSGEVLGTTGWVPVPFLVDVGADRTVFSAAVLRVLGVNSSPGKEMLAGVGGLAESVSITTKIRFKREDDTYVHFSADYAAFTNPAALDMSVLGRDITNLFAVIVDRPQDVVCLLGGTHRYQIVAN